MKLIDCPKTGKTVSFDYSNCFYCSMKGHATKGEDGKWSKGPTPNICYVQPYEYGEKREGKPMGRVPETSSEVNERYMKKRKEELTLRRKCAESNWLILDGLSGEEMNKLRKYMRGEKPRRMRR